MRTHICHFITDLDVGGAEMMLLKLLENSDRHLFQHTIISLMAGGNLKRQMEETRVPIFQLGIKKGKIPSPRIILSLLRRINSIKPDILQGWMYHGNIAAATASLLMTEEKKVLWNIRQSIYDIQKEKPLTAFLIRLGAKISSKMNGIIYNSFLSYKQHHRMGYSRLNSVVLPNGFDCARFSPDDDDRKRIRAELGFVADEIVIGLVARYHPMKDHLNFLQAATVLNHNFPDVHYVLVGSGMKRENEALMKNIQAGGLEKRVHLLGERQDVRRVTISFDIATSSSAWGEAFPNAIGEAMACAVPCVVTDVGDSSSIVGKTGIAVPPRNPEALANAWQKLVEMGSDNRSELGKAARDRIQENFDIRHITEQYESLYQKIMTQSIN